MDLTGWLGYVIEWMGAVAVIMIAGVSPLLKRIKPIQFRYPRREASYALSLFAVIYLLAFQFFSGNLFSSMRAATAGLSGGEPGQRMILAVAALIPFLAALAFRRQPILSAGWQKENLRAGLLVGLLLAMVSVFLRGKFVTLLKGVPSSTGTLLVVWLVTALAEETIFRGYIQFRMDAFLGSRWGWLAAAGLFLLWQLPGRLWVLPAGQLLPQILIAAAQSLLCSWIMHKTGHVAASALFRAFSGWILFV